MRETTRWTILATAVAVGLAGCTHYGSGPVEQGAKDRELQEARAAQALLSAKNARLEQQLRERQETTATAPNAQPPRINVRDRGDEISLLPQRAEPGECYSRLEIPPVFDTKTERVLKSAASERIEVKPAEYRWVEKRVMVEPSRERVVEVIPAQYKTVNERVLVEPATERVEVVEAQYKWVEERELVKPARKVWKPGRGAIERVDDETGAIMCLVEEPAEYKTIRKRVVSQPATTRTTKVPARYETVKRKVLERPEQVRKETIPARYETVRVQELVTPARERRVQIPAEYATVERQVQVRDARVEWGRVVCQTNATPELIARVQRQLRSQGFNPGKIDGRLGPATLRAVRSYERSNDLPAGTSGSIPYETLEALDIASPEEI